MKSLRVLSLTGNAVTFKTNNYRKSLILACVGLTFLIALPTSIEQIFLTTLFWNCHQNELRYLDERPVTEKDRLCTKAWLVIVLKYFIIVDSAHI